MSSFWLLKAKSLNWALLYSFQLHWRKQSKPSYNYPQYSKGRRAPVLWYGTMLGLWLLCLSYQWRWKIAGRKIRHCEWIYTNYIMKTNSKQFVDGNISYSYGPQFIYLAQADPNWKNIKVTPCGNGENHESLVLRNANRNWCKLKNDGQLNFRH